MLKFSDFSRLPQLDPLIQQVIADNQPGLVLVAGPEARPDHTGWGAFRFSSGRATLFDILVQEIVSANPGARAVYVSRSKATARPSRANKPRLSLALVKPPQTCAEVIHQAALRRPDLLIVDCIDDETLAAILDAAAAGLRVVTQLDTILWGARAAQHLQILGAKPEQLAALNWVIAAQRVGGLCSSCREPAALSDLQVERLRSRLPGHDFGLVEQFYRAGGCDRCQGSGRSGELLAFDIHRQPEPHFDPDRPSLLSLEEYLFQMARRGDLPIDDLLDLEADRLQLTYSALTARERALEQARSELQRKRVELDVANEVLRKRTEVLFSLEDTVQTLTATSDLEELAMRVCKRAGELSGADRGILYYLREAEGGEEIAEALAIIGWEGGLLYRQLDARRAFAGIQGREPFSYPQFPPGVQATQKDGGRESVPEKLTGLCLPLWAQDRRVGVMIVSSTQRRVFSPGDVALLRTFANQAALAIQRAGLVDELRSRLEQLEAAQAELVKKERMERELELARQVQQSVLPRRFPEVPGYRFAAQNEPARQVGGDFYDVIALEGEQVGLVIADVSDKGMPAALIMGLTRSLMLAEARRSASPKEVLESVNRLLLELGQAGQFISVFYGVLQAESRRLTYSRAGHDYPLLLRKGAVQSLGGRGAVLGILESEDLNLSEEQIDLHPGDRLVLYTDGLVDTTDPQGEFFGLERLQNLLLEHAGAGAEALCASVFKTLADFQADGTQFDDMTLLVVEVQE